MTLDQLQIIIKPLFDIGFEMTTYPWYHGEFRVEISRDKTEHWAKKYPEHFHKDIKLVLDQFWGTSPNSIEEAADDLINHMNQQGGMNQIIAEIKRR